VERLFNVLGLVKGGLLLVSILFLATLEVICANQTTLAQEAHQLCMIVWCALFIPFTAAIEIARNHHRAARKPLRVRVERSMNLPYVATYTAFIVVAPDGYQSEVLRALNVECHNPPIK